MDIASILATGNSFTHLQAKHQDMHELLALNDHAWFGEVWPKVSELSYNDVFRVKDTLVYVESALDKPGDLIECGVGRGGTALMTALTMRKLGVKKKLFLCDSFQGLPEPDRRFDKGFYRGQYATPREWIERMIEENGLGDLCVIVPGLFSDTLPKLAAEQTFCFANIDCDIYPSAVDCIKYLYPKLVPGAAMQFDEYYNALGGVTQAVNELVSRTGEVIHLGPVSHGTLIKGQTAANAGVAVSQVKLGEHTVSISADRLVKDQMYNTFLSHLQAGLHDGMPAFDRFVALSRGEG
jgi:hypothetical protein